MLTQQLAGFLQEGLSTHIASRNERLEPNAARVTALMVEADGLHVVAFVPAVSAGQILPDLAANGQVALVCARPPDERGCQVKGVFVDVREAGEDERADGRGPVGALPRQAGDDRPAARGDRRVGNLAVPGDPPPRPGAFRSDAGPGRGREAHVSVTLETLASCFQGLIPATLYTCSLDGVPNAAYLSHVDYVDAGTSRCRSSSSTRAAATSPRTRRRWCGVIDPDTSQSWALRLRLVRSETSGPLFERMALRIEAIASYCGLKGIFKLLAADIYEVLSIEKALDELAPEGAGGACRDVAAADPRFTMRALQDLSVRIHQADGLDELLDSILRGPRRDLRLPSLDDPGALRGAERAGDHRQPRLPGERRRRRGADRRRHHRRRRRGPEADSHLGAAARDAVRVRGGRAAHAQSGLCPPERIPLPGLAQPESQLGMPLLVRGELVGVLCIESEEPYRFHEEDKASIELLGSYLAIAIQNMQLQERAEDAVGGAGRGSRRRRPSALARLRPLPRRHGTRSRTTRATRS